MVGRPEEGTPLPQRSARPMGEGDGRDRSAEGRGGKITDCIPREAPQCQDCAGVRKETEFALEIGRARRLLRRGGPVARRRAPNGGRQVQVVIAESVPAVQGGRLVRIPHCMERTDQECRRTIAREDPACAIQPVGRRSEPYHDESGIRVTETGNAFPPILLVSELALSLAGDRSSVADEPGTACAGHDLLPDPLERVLHRFRSRDLLKALALAESPPMLTPRDLRV